MPFFQCPPCVGSAARRPTAAPGGAQLRRDPVPAAQRRVARRVADAFRHVFRCLLAPVRRCFVRKRAAAQTAPVHLGATPPSHATGAYGDGLTVREQKGGSEGRKTRNDDESAPVRWFPAGRGRPPVAPVPEAAAPSAPAAPAVLGVLSRAPSVQVQREMEIVQQWLKGNRPDASNSGPSLFRTKSDAVEAISRVVNEGCRPAIERLLDAVVGDALAVIRKAPKGRSILRFKTAPGLPQIDQEHILLEQIKAKFVGDPGRQAPFQAAVTPDVRAFLRGVGQAVATWSAQSERSRGSERNVVPGALVLRGVAAWASQRAPDHAPGSGEHALYSTAARMLMSLATNHPYRPMKEGEQAQVLAKAVDELKPTFQSSLAALVA